MEPNHEMERQDPHFEARVISTDLVISDALKLIKSMTNHDSLYNLMSKLVLFRGKYCFLIVIELPYMSKVSENRVMNTLTEFTHPGGPYFPTRPVR